MCRSCCDVAIWNSQAKLCASIALQISLWIFSVGFSDYAHALLTGCHSVEMGTPLWLKPCPFKHNLLVPIHSLSLVLVTPDNQHAPLCSCDFNVFKFDKWLICIILICQIFRFNLSGICLILSLSVYVFLNILCALRIIITSFPASLSSLQTFLCILCSFKFIPFFLTCYFVYEWVFLNVLIEPAPVLQC